MPIYFFWGEDDFTINQKVEEIKQASLDPNWSQFNYDKFTGDADNIIEALNQAMTPVFGMGHRVVWLANTTIGQHCSEALLSDLQRILPQIPTNSHLILTGNKKPDGRLKSSKLWQKYAQITEFSPIPPWKTEELIKQVETVAQKVGVKLTSKALEILAESVGNNTRQLWQELEKLYLYSENGKKTLDESAISWLVNSTTQNSLQLAGAIRLGQQERALGLVTDLINRNEPALKIVATLVGQFRTWTMIKLMLEEGGKDDKEIAQIAQIANPKRIYFLRKEIANISAKQLLACLPILLELEFTLKKGSQPLPTLQTKIIELSLLFRV